MGPFFQPTGGGDLGGFLTRFLHLAIYVKHALWLYYVDDFLLCQRWDVLPLTATFIIILLQLFGIPISWKKCDLSKEITWIGWQFHFSSGIVTLDINKRSKLIRLISSLQHQSWVHKKDLERFIGLASVYVDYPTVHWDATDVCTIFVRTFFLLIVSFTLQY